MQKLTSLTALSSKPVFSLPHEKPWCSGREQGPETVVLCLYAEVQQACVQCKKLTSATLPLSKAVFSLKHWCSGREQGHRLQRCAYMLKCSRAV